MADGAMNEFRGVYATYMYRYVMNEIQLNKYIVFFHCDIGLCIVSLPTKWL